MQVYKVSKETEQEGTRDKEHLHYILTYLLRYTLYIGTIRQVYNIQSAYQLMHSLNFILKLFLKCSDMFRSFDHHQGAVCSMLKLHC